MQVDLYNGHKMVDVVVVAASIVCNSRHRLQKGAKNFTNCI